MTTTNRPIPTQAEYEANEMRRLWKRLQDIEAHAPLAHRQEARKDWQEALQDPATLQRNAEWLMDGNYGFGEMQRAKEIRNLGKRVNRVALFGILLAALDHGCPRAFAVSAWKRLTLDQQSAAHEALLAALDAPEDED